MGLSLVQLKQLKQLDIPLEKIEYVRTTNLYKTIQKKLVEREIVVQRLYNILMALKAEKYAGTPDDKITNPLAIDTQASKPLYKNIEEKRIAFELGVEDGMVAYTGFQEYIPLGGPGAEINDVEFIGGRWRVQNKEHYDTINIQGKDFVLGDKLNHIEHTDFKFYDEFYDAKSTIWGGCGQFCSDKSNYVVAKYETGRGTFYAYGCKLSNKDAFATACAHIAGQVYMAYKPWIDADLKEKKANKLVQFEGTIISFQVKDPTTHAEYVRKLKVGEKLDRTESTEFEFYKAASVDWESDSDYIIAKYETGRGPFYAYGCKITEPDALATARADLAVQVCTAYKDLIEADTIRVLDRQK